VHFVLREESHENFLDRLKIPQLMSRVKILRQPPYSVELCGHKSGTLTNDIDEDNFIDFLDIITIQYIAPALHLVGRKFRWGNNCGQFFRSRPGPFAWLRSYENPDSNFKAH